MKKLLPGNRAAPPVYDRVFFCAYAANVFMLTAVSLLYRYADFVRSVGGNELHLGLIVGLGTVGAILFRFVQGSAIDWYGPITVWLVSLAGLATSLLMHLGIESAGNWPVYAARGLMNLCIAGVFGSWLSFVTLRVREEHVAEVVGVVGSSGFLGTAIGPVIGDWIFRLDFEPAVQVDVMFITAASIVVLAFVATSLAGWLELRSAGSFRAARRLRLEGVERVGPIELMRRYHPGFLLVVAGVMGLGISLPGTFLPMFVREKAFGDVKIFFLTYNAVAFASRLLFRTAPIRWGLRNTILTGLSGMAVSMLLYNVVDSQWSLVWPALAGGFAHALLFPAVVAGGTAFFPRANRGLATSLVLAMYDSGVLLGTPLAGFSVTVARAAGWPGYTTMFALVFSWIVTSAAVLGWKYRRGDGTGLQRR